ARRVTPDDDDATGVRHAERPLVERLDLVAPRALRAAETDQRPPRCAAHGGDVRDIHRERLGADIRGLRPTAPEVDVVNEQVGGDQQRGPRARLEHRAVVADAGHQTGRAPADERSDQPDEIVLARSVTGHGATAVLPRKLPSSRLPSTVRMDSGWN